MQETGLFIGRFQPFHKGHLATVKFALGMVGRLVIVVGSAQKSHELRNPFTAGERISMIKESLDADRDIDLRKVLIVPVPDVDVHSLWTRQVDMLVPYYDLVIANDPFTLMLFRERGTKVIEAPLQRRNELAATHIREMMIKGDSGWTKLVPPEIPGIIEKIDGVKRVKAIAENNSHDRYMH
ncbi:MAG TPA: nicotinamide-nucleotide adenylyltransferase [Nitrososphaera sp.]|nr:nicotinamide-nucleotide adenylyltransferase [Nitrososphaera sp.]